MKEIHSAAGDLYTLLIGRVAASLFGLANVLILTRLFDPEDYGRYTLFLMVVNIGVTFGVTWSSIATVRFGKEELIREGSLRKVFWGRTLVLGLSLVATIFTAALYSGKVMAYTGLPAALFPVAVAGVLFLAFHDHFLRSLQAAARLRAFATVSAAQIAFLTVGILFLAAGWIPRSVETLVWVFAFTTLGALGLSAILLPAGLYLPPRIDGPTVRAIFRYSFPQLLGSGAGYLIGWINIIVIREFLGTADVGIYQLSHRFYASIIALVMVISTVLTPMMVSFRTRGDEKWVRRFAAEGVPLLLLLFGFILIPGGLAIRLLIENFAPETYHASVPCFLVLLNACLFRFLGISLMPIFHAYDRVAEVQAANVGVAVINVGLALILVPRFGIIGAAAATAIAFLAGGIALQIRIRDLSRVREGKASLAMIVSVGGFCAIAAASGTAGALLWGGLALAVLFLLAMKGSFVNDKTLDLLDLIHMSDRTRSLIAGPLRFLANQGRSRPGRKAS